MTASPSSTPSRLRMRHPTRVRGNLCGTRGPLRRLAGDPRQLPCRRPAGHLGRPRRRLADIQDLHPRGRRAERCLSRRRHSNSGPDRDRTQSCPAQCDGFGGRYVLAGGSIPGGFGHALELDGMQRITLEDSELGGALLIETGQSVAIQGQAACTSRSPTAGSRKSCRAPPSSLSSR